jgi:hypothetical protein
MAVGRCAPHLLLARVTQHLLLHMALRTNCFLPHHRAALVHQETAISKLLLVGEQIVQAGLKRSADQQAASTKGDWLNS